ncbi:MAG: AAA family ATPase [Gammaproteobacteria bacterium]|nr:AAA family ATPase [Gammaproteobacteria bacterium]
MKLPYGIYDFEAIITENYFYADRTDRIPLLEEAGRQLLFLRPHRFGKSLLLSMLENYYDLAKADQFESLFGHLAIGQNPTARHNRYFVLKWDFSAVSPQGDAEEIKQNLHDYVNVSIREFNAYYKAFLPDILQIYPDNALASFQSLVSAVRQTSHPLYLLIDEYDNFANEVVMNAESGGNKQTLLSGEDTLKALFKLVKSAAAGRGLERVFIVGISPGAMSGITSAYNVAENICLRPEFNDLCGFREEEISDMLQQTVKDCELSARKADEALELMRTFYNGYCFNPRKQDFIYNPVLAIYFLKNLQRNRECPQKLFDSNLSMESSIQYISRLPDGQRILLNALAGQPPVSIPELADRFGVKDMLEARKDSTFMASLLYYFGTLTMAGKAPFGETALKIPNLVTRALYAERIRDALLLDNKN